MKVLIKSSCFAIYTDVLEIHQYRIRYCTFWLVHIRLESNLWLLDIEYR